MRSLRFWNYTISCNFMIRNKHYSTTFKKLLIDNKNTSSSDVWDWVPPANRNLPVDTYGNTNYVIPVQKGIFLTPEEVKMYLESQGAENPIIINITDFDNFKHFIIASGRSIRHIRKMSESIMAAMKERNLLKVMGFKGIEGEKDDDWQLVNCGNFIVHIMLPETREHLDLEAHWSMKIRPTIKYSRNPKEYEENFEILLDKYPCPDDYIKTSDIIGTETIVKEF